MSNQNEDRPFKKAKQDSGDIAEPVLSVPSSSQEKGSLVRESVQSHIFDDEENLKHAYIEAKPFPHGVLRGVLHEEFAKKILQEVKQSSKVNFKESDLFRVYQSMDMVNLSDTEDRDTYLNILKLRSILYSTEWRHYIERLCHLPLGTLTEQVDCAFNCHTTGCHLLCHDDVIGNRKISYIFYLTDPDWTATECGALELYDRYEEKTTQQTNMTHDDKADVDSKPPARSSSENHAPRAVPQSTPECNILPIWNHMAFFAVQPGVSFHAVQEVLGDRPRLSLQGWYHAAHAPEHSESVTLHRLKSVAKMSAFNKDNDDVVPFAPLIYPPCNPDDNDENDESEWLTKSDRDYLSKYVDDTYLTESALESISARFEEDSSVQLRQILSHEWIYKINKLRQEEETNNAKSVLDKNYYEQGITEEWKLQSPAHKQRFLEYQARQGSSSSQKEPSNDSKNDSLGAVMQQIKQELLCSIPFQRFLAKITSLGLPLGQKGRIRRFRKGLDYTVAHYGILTQKSVLDATLCLVAGEAGKASNTAVQNDEDPLPASATSDVTEEDPNMEDLIWESGDCGGFECYIAADDSEEGEAGAADEYNQDDDTELLSVTPSNNTLSLVYRDSGTMRFIKYVGAGAPSSRWDIAMEYDIAVEEENEDSSEYEAVEECT